MTDITNPAEAADGDIVDRLVDAFAKAGAEANGRGVLPDALAELAERVGGDDTDLGAVLLAVADIIEAVTDT